MNNKDNFPPPYMYKGFETDTEKKVALETLRSIAPQLIEENAKTKAAYKAVETIAVEMTYLHTLPCTPTKGKKLEDADNRLIETARYLKQKNIEFFGVLDKAIKALTEQTIANCKLNEKNAALTAVASQALALLEGNTQKISDKVTELEAKATELSNKIDAEKNQLKETAPNPQLTEIQNQISKDQTRLQEIQDEIDTLKLHTKPHFKAHVQVDKPTPSFQQPYKYGA